MMERKGVEVIAGVNLPMLVKLAKVRSKQPLADAVNCARGGGTKIHRRRLARAARLQGSTAPADDVAGGDGFPADGDRAGMPVRPGPRPASSHVPNKRGLHARAAAKFVTLAERFGASVDVIRDGQSVLGPLHHGADDAGRRQGRRDRTARRGLGRQGGAGRAGRAGRVRLQ